MSAVAAQKQRMCLIANTPGTAVVIAPGHDAWIVGDEPCVFIDLGGLRGYAQSQALR